MHKQGPIRVMCAFYTGKQSDGKIPAVLFCALSGQFLTAARPATWAVQLSLNTNFSVLPIERNSLK